ncbi:MAG: GNAT family N-acetyltransferase [Flavobacteriaceae bacterium]
MKMIPVSKDTISTYIEVGINSYCQHYLHLWPEKDPAPYIENSFTTEVVQQDLKNPNLRHFILSEDNEFVGILKIVVDAAIAQYTEKEAMLLEKIYLLAPYSGKGLGKLFLMNVMDLAVSYGKNILWLDTMKKGRALSFYLDFGFYIIGEKELEFPSALEDQKSMYLMVYELQ